MDALDPRHGTYAGAAAHNKHGTPFCPPCAQAHYVYRKRLRTQHARGIRNRIPLGQDAWEVVDRWTRVQLHEATGIDRSMLGRLHRAGPEAVVLRTTKQKLLNAQPAFTPIGIQRRLRALVAIGYSAAALASLMGTHCQGVKNIIKGGEPQFVRRDLGLAIVRLYEELESKPAPVVYGGRSAARMRNRAERNGWHPPAAWDYIDTDPEPDSSRRPHGSPPVLLENYDYLIAAGESHDQALKQLDVTPQAIDRARSRARKVAA